VLVVLDACVLYPASLRDVLLTLAALDDYDVVWTDEILDEVRRDVVADHCDIDPTTFTSHTLGDRLSRRWVRPALAPSEILDLSGNLRPERRLMRPSWWWWCRRRRG
jgi:hypothetical protein